MLLSKRPVDLGEFARVLCAVLPTHGLIRCFIYCFSQENYASSNSGIREPIRSDRVTNRDDDRSFGMISVSTYISLQHFLHHRTYHFPHLLHFTIDLSITNIQTNIPSNQITTMILPSNETVTSANAAPPAYTAAEAPAPRYAPKKDFGKAFAELQGRYGCELFPLIRWVGSDGLSHCQMTAWRLFSPTRNTSPRRRRSAPAPTILPSRRNRSSSLSRTLSLDLPPSPPNELLLLRTHALSFRNKAALTDVSLALQRIVFRYRSQP